MFIINSLWRHVVYRSSLQGKFPVSKFKIIKHTVYASIRLWKRSGIYLFYSVKPNHLLQNSRVELAFLATVREFVFERETFCIQSNCFISCLVAEVLCKYIIMVHQNLRQNLTSSGIFLRSSPCWNAINLITCSPGFFRVILYGIAYHQRINGLSPLGIAW